jgi:hypothetical protein
MSLAQGAIPTAPAKRPNRLRITVVGGFDPEDTRGLDRTATQMKEFAAELGRQIINQGHMLLNGCMNELDAVVAHAAYEAGQATPHNGSAIKVMSYLLQGHQPAHDVGTIIQSDLEDWDIGGQELTSPEVIRHADVIVLLGGFFGTFKAANWARIDGKPLLPFAIFGGAAKQVYTEESRRFERAYSPNIERIEYDQVLKSLSTDWKELARSTVSLAEKVVTSPNVFVIMSYSDSAQLKDLYKAVQRVCKEYAYVARRVDESNLFKRIVPEISRQLRNCAFVIAEISEAKPNVYYELGVADGLGKAIIVVARKGTELPFDVKDIPVIFWDAISDFEEELKTRVANIGATQGRA